MIATPKYLVLLVSLLAFQPLIAQAEHPDPVKDLKPPKNRELFHDFVDKQQKEILKSDGKGDDEFKPSSDDEVNFLLTRAAPTNADWGKSGIEKTTTLTPQEKI